MFVLSSSAPAIRVPVEMKKTQPGMAQVRALSSKRSYFRESLSKFSPASSCGGGVQPTRAAQTNAHRIAPIAMARDRNTSNRISFGIQTNTDRVSGSARLLNGHHPGATTGRATEEGNDSALKPDTSTELTMDEALNLVGDFGPAQWRVCIFACSCWVPLAMHAIAASFFKADMVSAGLWGMHEAPWMLTMIDSSFFMGFLSGAFAFGAFSDSRGRRPALLMSVALCAVAGAMCGFCTSFQQFIVARVLVGLAVGGMVHNSFLLATECVGSSARHVMGTAFNVVWVAGCVAVVAAAYLVPAWRPMLLLFSVPTALLLLYGVQTAPESPRWLLLNKGSEAAASQLQTMAQQNNKVLPALRLVNQNSSESSSTTTRAANPWRSISPSTFLALMFATFTISLVFYGLTLSVNEQPGSVHLNSIITALAETPAYLLAAPLMGTFLGRKGTTGGALVIGGCAITLALVFQSAAVQMICLTIGKMCVTIGFATVFLSAAEVLPTEIRNTGMAILRVVDGLGGMLAPACLLLGATTCKAAPLLVFACVAFLSGVGFLLSVPETKDRQMA